MKKQDFRRYAHETVDWMADYLEQVENMKVFSNPEPGSIKAVLDKNPPKTGESYKAIIEDFQNIIVPNMTHWNHPRFFGYFPANTSPPSILAEMLTAAMGAQCMSWLTSPAAAELEELVMEWLREMTGIPAHMTGVIQDTASTSTLTALICARERATSGRFSRVGGSCLEGTRLIVYASTEAHSSVFKAAALAGFGSENIRWIPVDQDYAMRADKLEEFLEEDIRQGFKPAAVVATIGTTGSTGIDPLQEIASIGQKHGIWVHVDAALGGTAAILEEKRHLFAGIQHADSFVFNPHKWMFTNFDCSAYFVRDVDALLRTMSTQPEYLQTAHDEKVNNYRDWGIPLGRRFRALKLWFVIRSYGIQGLKEMVRNHLRLAADLAEKIRNTKNWELLAPVALNLVCFRYKPDLPGLDEEALDRLNETLLAEINRTGFCMLTHTRLAGRYALRMSIGQTYTEKRHVEETWKLIQDTAIKMA